METYELRYFIAVARTENVHRAARELAVSPGSLSKAVARLEDELGVQLFERVSRNIRLTRDGRLLQARATAILQLEEATRLELSGGKAAFQVRLVGPEILLAKVGPDLAARLKTTHPQATFVFHVGDEQETERAVMLGEAQLGLTTAEVPAGVSQKRLFDTTFKTCVGKGHPLYRAAAAGKTIAVEEVLRHAFVSPDRPILGLIGKKQALDGWRDDKFPRRIGFVADSLQLVEELVSRGDVVGYLPDYYVQRIGATALRISGCPYSCNQTVKLMARDPRRASWLAGLFS